MLVIAQPLRAKDYASAELTANRIEIHNDDGALFEAGSIAKYACSIAILRLADRDVLSLDDPIGAILPQFEDLPAGTVKLRHVLASRSGIADGLMPALRADPGKVMAITDPAQAAVQFSSGELAAEPDTLWSYDLVNWIIAQAVIEKATDLALDQALLQLVLEPAGMGSSEIFSGTTGAAFAPPAEPSRPLPRFLQCAGGLATTPIDLLALARFPHNGGLSAASLAELMEVNTPEQSYTLGGRYRMSNAGKPLSWQSGSNGAYKSLVVYDPESDRGFAAMTASGSDKGIQAGRGEWLADQD